jgi:hypothetical protein
MSKAVEIGRLHRQCTQRRDRSSISMGPSQAGARRQLDLVAVDPRMHAVAIVLDLVQSARRRRLYQARELRLDPFGRPRCRSHEATAAHPSSRGKLAADVWAVGQCPWWVGCVGRANRDCFSLPDGVARVLTANLKYEIDRLWPTRGSGPRRQSLSVLTNCSRVLCRSSSEGGSPMGTGDGATLDDTAIALRPWG